MPAGRRGGFGFVYQAQDTLLHREIVIKELVPALAGDVVTGKLDVRQAAAHLSQEGDKEYTEGMDGAGAEVNDDERHPLTRS